MVPAERRPFFDVVDVEFKKKKLCPPPSNRETICCDHTDKEQFAPRLPLPFLFSPALLIVMIALCCFPSI